MLHVRVNGQIGAALKAALGTNVLPVHGRARIASMPDGEGLTYTYYINDDLLSDEQRAALEKVFPGRAAYLRYIQNVDWNCWRMNPGYPIRAKYCEWLMKPAEKREKHNA